jgi:hypothetical protein
MFFIDIIKDINFAAEVDTALVTKNLFSTFALNGQIHFSFYSKNTYLQDGKDFYDTNFV